VASKHSARDEQSVASLYRGVEVAETYIRKRFNHAWSLLLHRKQDDAGTAIRQRFNLARNPVILTVGRLQRRKGHDMVIKAIPAIKRIFPQIKYLISVNIGVPDSVVFAGRVTDEELPHYYAAYDVFIMPSRELNGDIEGFGIVYLEAAAAGKPVIGGRSGGTDDAILDGVTGLRVDGTNSEEIAAAVIELLSDPQKAQAIGEAGYSCVAADFTWDAVAQRTLALSLSL
jgi:phosphatidyl-myo-inositol dimannoside synthase